ncbi:MAG: hypothetical protein ACYC96_05825 [Fimbriimonadaceae bacterium]
MNRIARLSVVLTILAFAATGSATTIAGKWTGKLAVKFVPPHTGPTISAEDVKRAQTFLNSIQIILTLSPKGTYVAITKGPQRPDAETKGKWTLKGKKLTLTPSEKNRPPEVGLLAANGKTLTMSLPKDMSEQGVSGHAVFTKG